jgi:hypothetical protein
LVNAHLIRGVFGYVQYCIVRRIAALLEQSHVGEEARSYAGWLSVIWTSMITSETDVKHVTISVSITSLGDCYQPPADCHRWTRNSIYLSTTIESDALQSISAENVLSTRQ